VKLLFAAILLASGSAYADDRCAAGIAFAEKGDLSRASLYLEGCSDEAATDAAATVAKKLRASDLSALSISSTPEGLDAQTDALPGETFKTPATVWVKAGTYTVTVAGLSQRATVAAHSRAPVIIDARQRATTPKDGKVDFNDETPEQSAHAGPPPDLKHGTLLPKKYLGPSAPAGPELEDPFALHDSHVAWRLGARIGGGMLSQGTTGIGFSVAALASRPIDGPVFLATRLDWSHRTLDTIGINAGVAVKLAETDAIVLSAGAAMRGVVHLQDTLAMEPVSRAGLGGAADLDLAILPLPLALGLRYEQGFTELVTGSRDRAILLEAGYDWR
jgi:hypothetical protein